MGIGVAVKTSFLLASKKKIARLSIPMRHIDSRRLPECAGIIILIVLVIAMWGVVVATG